MKTFYVLWTYAANYSPLMKVKANTPEEAALQSTHSFSDDFRKTANVYVFEHPPVFKVKAGQIVKGDA